MKSQAVSPSAQRPYGLQRVTRVWQIARSTSADTTIHAAVGRRMMWDDRELVDRLETDLEERMRRLDRPMTDLSVMWDAGR